MSAGIIGQVRKAADWADQKIPRLLPNATLCFATRAVIAAHWMVAKQEVFTTQMIDARDRAVKIAATYAGPDLTHANLAFDLSLVEYRAGVEKLGKALEDFDAQPSRYLFPLLRDKPQAGERDLFDAASVTIMDMSIVRANSYAALDEALYGCVWPGDYTAQTSAARLDRLFAECALSDLHGCWPELSAYSALYRPYVFSRLVR